MAGFGGLGGFGSGLGGPEFPDILTALGTALLSSPRDAPFANLPQTLQTATDRSRQRGADLALVTALKQAGVENPELLALNPTAATLAISQANLSKRAAIGAGLTEAVKGLYGPGAGAPNSSDAAAPGGGLSGLGGPRVPTFATISGDRPSGSIANIITNAAARHGVDPDTLVRTAQIESGLNPGAANPNSSASGLFQFINSTARQYGLNNPRDPAASADAGARMMKDNTEQLYSVLGRKPEPWELYLAHQQGVAGATRLLSHPSARAVDLVGADAVRLNGGNANMTAAQFAGLWRQKFGPTYNQADSGRALGDVARPNQAAAAPPDPDTEFQPTTAADRDRALSVPGTQVAAAGATKLPTPIQVPPALLKPLAESGFKPGTATHTAQARHKQQVALQLILGSAAMGDDGKQFAEFGKLLWQDAGKYLDPTDTTRALVQAGIDPNSERGQQIQRFALEEPQLKFAQAERQYARSVQEHGERMGLERQRFAESRLTEEEKRARSLTEGPYAPAIEVQRVREDERKAAAAGSVVKSEAQAKAAANIPNVDSVAHEALAHAAELARHKGLKSAVGFGSYFPSARGGEAANFESLLEQAKGGTLLDAMNTMRGTGSISEGEGKAGAAAVAALDPKQSEPQFRENLLRYQARVVSGMNTARKDAGQEPLTSYNYSQIVDELKDARAALAKGKDPEAVRGLLQKRLGVDVLRYIQ